MDLGFIGIGNIATSVIKGLCTSNSTSHINISPRNKEKSLFLEGLFDTVTRMDSNQSVLDRSEVIFIALPPVLAKEILKGLSFHEGHRVVSLVPFLDREELLNSVAPATKVSRAVPFPTVENHECPILLYHPDETISGIFKNIGTPIPVASESELKLLWTLTGLIAPFYDLTETLSHWAQSHNVEASVANRYVMELFSSLTCYSRKRIPFDFSELKKEATTPNGLNDQALKMIKQQEANTAYRMAAEALYKRFK
ncbi:NAD(P)-binding domain-containing protein [Sinomicrobium sp. M5D2P17]